MHLDKSSSSSKSDVDARNYEKYETSKPAAVIGSLFFLSLYAGAHILQLNHILAAFLKVLIGYYLSWITIDGKYSFKNLMKDKTKFSMCKEISHS